MSPIQVWFSDDDFLSPFAKLSPISYNEKNTFINHLAFPLFMTATDPNQELNTSYRIYKALEDKTNTLSYIADGFGTRRIDEVTPSGPLFVSDLRSLPKELLRAHAFYMEAYGWREAFSKSEDLYLDFSFEPSSQKLFHFGKFYSTSPLNEKEQEQFCNGITEIYESLDELVYFDSLPSSLC